VPIYRPEVVFGEKSRFLGVNSNMSSVSDAADTMQHASLFEILHVEMLEYVGIDLQCPQPPYNFFKTEVYLPSQSVTA